MFRLFFPCLTFCNMYNASWETMPSATFMLVVVGSVLGGRNSRLASRPMMSTRSHCMVRPLYPVRQPLEYW